MDKRKEKADMVKLAELPVARQLIEMLLYEALQPLASENQTVLNIKTGRRNLAVELLIQMEVIK